MRRVSLPRLGVVFILGLLALGPANAQPAGSNSGDLNLGDVSPHAIRLYYLAVPPAINACSVADTRGVTEALSGTAVRDLTLAGHFKLISPDAYLHDPTKEGMSPDFGGWFNIGAEGLVKISYCIVGTNVDVDMRLYDVTASRTIAFPAPYDAPTKIPLDPSKLRLHAHGFVNQVMRHFTGSEGFFLSRIVFVKRVARGKELFMISPDGNDEVQLTKNGSINMLPTYRKGRIYFTSFLGGNPDLFTLSGGKEKRFAHYTGLNTGGTLSPSGHAVAATLSKDGNPEIYLLSPADGSVVKRLTTSWGIDTSPSWSPDGKQVAFVSDRHGSPQIWIMNADGSEPRRVTFQGEYNQTPAWSPRGDLIVFTARDERAVFDLFTVRVKDGHIERLTQDQGNNEDPSWSPDGRYIVFSSTRSGESKLYIMTSGGQVQRRLSRGKGEYLNPSWGR